MSLETLTGRHPLSNGEAVNGTTAIDIDDVVVTEATAEATI